MPLEERKCSRCGSPQIEKIDGVYRCVNCQAILDNPNEIRKTKVHIYKDEAKLAEIKAKSEQDRHDEKVGIIILTIWAAFTVLLILGLIIWGPGHKVPVNSAADYKNKDKNVVVNSLRDAGFLRVDAIELKDLSPRERAKEGLVTNVTVGGDDKWVKGLFNSKKEYSRFTHVKVYYHSMNPDAFIDAPEGNGNVYKGLDYTKVQQALIESGFSDIHIYALGDLVPGEDEKIGKTDHVTINGEVEWSEGFLQSQRRQYKMSDKVIIFYHSY